MLTLPQYDQFVNGLMSPKYKESNEWMLVGSALGLVGEAIENQQHPDFNIDEIGDVVWYISACAQALGSSMLEIAEMRPALKFYGPMPLFIVHKAGAYAERIKKVVLHGKQADDMKLLLHKVYIGVVQWCHDNSTTISEVIDYNVNKLQDRYPGGKFDPERAHI